MLAIIAVDRDDTGALAIAPGAEPEEWAECEAYGCEAQREADLKGWEPWTEVVRVYIPIGGGWDERLYFRGEV